MRIHETDNVEIRADGMKYALCDIARGEQVMKYGFPIGEATEDIKEGEKVHSHNLKSRLSGLGGWEYRPETHEAGAPIKGTFMGYRRADGRVGIRNELWIIPTVGCINDVARELAAKTGAKALTHPYGCSQLGGDLATTGKTLAGLVRHPNAGGVLVLGLGCEELHMKLFREVLGEVDGERVKFLNLQECEDETAEALALIDQLKEEKKNGTALILWTCRQGKQLEAAVSWCKKQGLTFNTVNQNLKERIRAFHGDTRKISADIYLEDRAAIFTFGEKLELGGGG